MRSCLKTTLLKSILYPLCSGLVVVLITGITFAPLVHAFLYRLHLETKDEEPEA